MSIRGSRTLQREVMVGVEQQLSVPPVWFIKRFGLDNVDQLALIALIS